MQRLKISIEGTVEKEITNARHGIIQRSSDSSFLAKFSPFVDRTNWYNPSHRLKELLKNYDFEVKQIFYWDSSEIIKVHFASKGNFKKLQEKGFYYIDARTHNVLRYEKEVMISKMNIPLLMKITDFHIHLKENFSPGNPFSSLSNASLSA